MGCKEWQPWWHLWEEVPLLDGMEDRQSGQLALGMVSLQLYKKNIRG